MPKHPLRLWERIIVLPGDCAAGDQESSRTQHLRYSGVYSTANKKQETSLNFLLTSYASVSSSFNVIFMSCNTGNSRMIASLQLDITIKEIYNLLTIKKIQMWKEITLVIHLSGNFPPFRWCRSKPKTKNQLN